MSGPDNFLPPAVRKALSKDRTRGEFKAENSTWTYRLSPENGHALEELLLVDEQGAIQVIEKQTMSQNSATAFGLTSKSYEAYDRRGKLRRKHVLTFDSFEIGKTDQSFSFEQLDVPAGSRIVVNDGASHEVRIVRPPSTAQTKGKSIKQVIDGSY